MNETIHRKISTEIQSHSKFYGGVTSMTSIPKTFLSCLVFIVGLSRALAAAELSVGSRSNAVDPARKTSTEVAPDFALWGFGDNTAGQLGTTVVTPKQVGSDLKQVSAGGSHSLILKTDGSLWAVGGNSYGQLGDGTSLDRYSAVQILASGVQSISASNDHSLIVKTDGSLWAMGANNRGELGDGTTTQRNSPVQILASGVQAVAAGGAYKVTGGSYSMFVKTDGSLWATGWRNTQIGDGPISFGINPVQILASGVKSVSAGANASMIVKTDGSLWAMGYNENGDLGDGTTTYRSTPVEILASGVQSASVGDLHSLVVKTDGSLWATGYNFDGELGDGTTVERHALVQILANGVQNISAGKRYSLFVKADGSLWAMGGNSNGELGDGVITSGLLPVQILDGGVGSVATGPYHSLVVKTDGSLWATGSNSKGQLGNGGTAPRKQLLQVLGGVKSVAAGTEYSLIVKSDGSLWATGDNFYGQLGDGSTTERHTPVMIMASGVQSVSAGQANSLIVKTDGSLWGMGGNFHGELGDGTTTERDTPVQIMASGVKSASAGQSHSLIVKNDGSLWAMGGNFDGQLGDGTTTDRLTPVLIMASGVQSANAEQAHSLIVKTDGSLWAMGGNFHGELGDGTTVERHTPVQILASGVKSTAGSIIVKTDGSLWASGPNNTASLGDGTGIDRLYPVQILSSGVQSVDSVWTTLLTTDPGIAFPKNTASIDSAPLSLNVLEGGSASFSVTAHGSGTLAIQWYKDNKAILGANSLTYSLSAATKTDVGSYWVSVSNGIGSVSSTKAYLNVLSAQTAPQIVAQPLSTTSAAGSSITLNVSSLGDAGATYQWFKDGIAIAGATGSSYDSPSTSASDAGLYTVAITNASGTTTSRPATVTIADPVPGRIVNASIRALHERGQSLIFGFVTSGGSKPYLIRAAGPSLDAFHVTGFLKDPNLQIYNGPSVGTWNDNWADGGLADSLSAAFNKVGAFPFVDSTSKDASILADVDGARTVRIESTSYAESSGVVLVECYDTGSGTSPHIINLSTRNFAGEGENTLIAGFVIDGNVPKKFLIRGIGPGLSGFSITDFMKDPRVEIFMRSGGVNTSCGSNDDWNDEPDALTTFAACGAFGLPSASKDAAIVVTLSPGVYTAVVTAPSGDTGQALVEVYEVP